MKNKYIVISVVAVAAVIAVVLFAGINLHLLSAAYTLPIPTAIYSGTIYSNPNQLISNGQPTGPGLVAGTASYSTNPAAVDYPISWYQPFYNGNNEQFNGAASTNLYVAVNVSGASFASSADTSEVPAINSTIQQYQAAAASATGPSLNAYNAQITAWQNIRSILLAAVRYNNALLISTTTTTTSTTSTIPKVSVSPPILTNFWNGIQALWISLVAFFNIKVFAVSAPSNFTVSTPFSVQVSNLQIPAQWQSQNFTVSQYVKRIQYTYCAPFVINNASTALYQGFPMLTNGSSYSVNFTYTPTSRQILIAGAACRSTNSTYNYITGNQSSWSAFITVANQSTTIHAGVNIAKPNVLAQFWNGILTFFNNLLKSIGL